ncbi:hypothetical protein SCLCIDRAFT_30246 [Scleroderma citrinum Foug A]|uniref:Uncharacterized protein n=1 Tax=Scleroderma citrinum Foug A TaxID=1036808 RepID=A0A0C2Z1D0_9AGAM|nr:hypothetical protein SCLCIDRAFT_30246 [Scleroderma citrinum Foug A]
MTKTMATKRAWQMPPRYNNNNNEGHADHTTYELYWPKGIPVQLACGYTLGYFCCVPAVSQSE